MGFLRDLFNDNNDINDKAFIGFLSFSVCALYALCDQITGLIGKEFIIEPIILEVFAALTFGCFGISGFEKIQNRKTDAEREKNLPGGLDPLPEDEG